MKKLLKIMNHPLSKLQKENLKNNFNIDTILLLPEKLQNYLKNIPADENLNLEVLKEITSFIKKNLDKDDYLIIQGEFGITYYLVNFCLKNSYNAIYATTKRVYQETINSDGSIDRKHIFKFIKFRKYIEYLK